MNAVCKRRGAINLSKYWQHEQRWKIPTVCKETVKECQSERESEREKWKHPSFYIQNVQQQYRSDLKKMNKINGSPNIYESKDQSVCSNPNWFTVFTVGIIWDCRRVILVLFLWGARQNCLSHFIHTLTTPLEYLRQYEKERERLRARRINASRRILSKLISRQKRLYNRFLLGKILVTSLC